MYSNEEEYEFTVDCTATIEIDNNIMQKSDVVKQIGLTAGLLNILFLIKLFKSILTLFS